METMLKPKEPFPENGSYEEKAPSPLREAFRSFKKNKLAVIGTLIILFFIVLALLAPLLRPEGFDAQVLGDRLKAPSAEHWFGTDDAGKDVFSNFIHGARVSLIVGFFAAFISIFIGGLIGVVAGFYGGRVENLLMRKMILVLR